MGAGIKQVKDGCWTFGDGDKVCYPYPVAGGGAGYVYLEKELEKLGFKLSDEENDWFFGDDLDDTGVFRQAITFNESSFNNFLNTVDNSVVCFVNLLGVLNTDAEYSREGTFFLVAPSGGGITLYSYSLQIYYEYATNNLVFIVTLNTFDTANP